MKNKLSTALRDYSRRLMDVRLQHQDDEDILQLLFDSAEFASVLARIVEGKDLHAAFGAPGDWGYQTEIGQGLSEFYSRPKTERV